MRTDATVSSNINNTVKMGRQLSQVLLGVK